MTPLDQFHLGASTEDGLSAALLDASDEQLALVDGTILEAQFGVAGDSLIITTAGDPFEDSLHITLLGRAFDTLDSVSLGIPYGTGAFRVQEVGPAERLRFSFFADDVWRLDVLRDSQFVFARPLGAARYGGGAWRRHRLVLSREGKLGARRA
jgi:hypothetical protein